MATNSSNSGAAKGEAEWRAYSLPLNDLASERDQKRRLGAAEVARIVGSTPPERLAAVETSIRAIGMGYHFWYDLRAAWIGRQDWPLHVWGVFSFHRNGYVRELAVERLALLPEVACVLPYLLLRLNDWVTEVRVTAEHAVKRLISLEHAQAWVRVLGMLGSLCHRTRSDHAWLSEQVELLFLRPETRGLLGQAIASDDRWIARWAASCAMKLGPEDREAFIEAGIGHVDPLVRFRAARAARESGESPRRERWLRTLSQDASVSCRREVLHARLADEPATRVAALRAFLLDRHASIRHAARVYLRDDPEPAGRAIEPRSVYLQMIESPDVVTLVGAIGGLGECGVKEDADRLAGFVTHERARVAVAAVRAVARLDGGKRVEWMVGPLGDSRASVSKEALRALSDQVPCLPVERIREAVLRGASVHAKVNALRLLLKRRPFEAVVDAMEACASLEARLSNIGREYIDLLYTRHERVAPSDEHVEAVKACLARAGHALTAEQRRKVEVLVGLPEVPRAFSKASDELGSPPSHVRELLRGVFILIGVVLFLVGAWHLWEGIKHRSRCYEAEAARVLDLAFDAGEVGVHRAMVEQRHSFTCKQSLRLDAPATGDEDPDELLRGLRLTITVTNAKGESHIAADLPFTYEGQPAWEDRWSRRFTPWPTGEYTIAAEVVSPAPAVRGRGVRVVSEYELCGLEWMGVTYLMTIGIGGTGLGLLLGWAAYAMGRRRVSRG